MLLRGEETETFLESDPLQKRSDRLRTTACLRSTLGGRRGTAALRHLILSLRHREMVLPGLSPAQSWFLNLSLLPLNCPQDHFASYLLLFLDLHPPSPSLRQCQVESISQSSMSSVPEAGSASYSNHRNKD